MAVSTLVALILVGLGLGAAVAIARTVKDTTDEEERDVVFAERPKPAVPAPVVVEPEPPPEPEPPVAVPPDVKITPVVKKHNKPAPPPKQLPDKAAAEADPATAPPVEVATTTGDEPVGPAPPVEKPVENIEPVKTEEPKTEEPKPEPPPKKKVAKRRAPVNLPENATPPKPDSDNAPPEYPEEMRTQGIEAQVVLKIVVSETGAVTSVQVLKGDEPFASAAAAAVKRWHYTPALVDGEPTPVYRIVKVPFRLKS